MEIEKQIIKTYSRRQPITRYESRAVLVPSYTNPTRVRESRLNDKTLVVDNFDDTFDRLVTGVAVPSPENSLDENGVAKKKESDDFDVFKMPLQTKKKPKQKEKPKKKNLVSKAASVKRKKVDVDSDDSGLSDQEETHKKQTDDNKSKEKVKRVVKKKKDVSLAKVVVDHKLVASESADENAPNNIYNKAKESTESVNYFNKLKEHSLNQHKIQRYFQASTPRVDRIQTNIDMQNLSPVAMNIANEKTVLHLSMDKEQAENAADDERNANEHVHENTEYNQSNATNATLNFVKPKELTRVDLLKTSKHLLTSTPRVNKIRVPVNLQHLSPIILDKEKRVTSSEKSSVVDAGTEDDQHDDDYVQVPSEPVVESIKPPSKVSEIEHSDNKGSEELLSQEKTDANQFDQQELPVSNVANENNKDKSINGNHRSESIIDDHDDSLFPTAGIESNMKQLLPENTQNYAHSPLMFDESEYVQNEVGKSNVDTDLDKVDNVQINFSQNFSENIEQNNKELDNSKSTHVGPSTVRNKNFNVSTESSFYPGDWTNDYNSTYDYDQLKNNHERIDSKLDKDENKNSVSGTEDTDIISAVNFSDIIEVANIDNAEIQSVENDEQEKAEDTLCDGGNVIDNSKNELDEQEEHHNAPSISNKDYHDSTNVEEANLQNSQITDDEKQSSHRDESANKETQCRSKDKSASLINQPDESLTLSDIAGLNDQSPIVTARPSKRRKTYTNEILIFDNLEDNHANVQSEEVLVDESDRNIAEPISVPEDTIGKNVITESIDNTSSVKSDQQEELIQKLSDKELQIVLSRVNYEEYKSPISSPKPIKGKLAKRASRKFKDSNVESVSEKKKKKQSTKSNDSKVTRRSAIEDKMRQLYIQYQCKNVTICAMRLEDQKIDLPLRRGLKRKSRGNNIAENNELDNSLTNGGLSEFLLKLNDPVKVTMRRKTQKKYDRHLAAINEDQAGRNSEDVTGKKIVTWGNNKRVTFNDIEENPEEIEDNDHISQPIFLKPGKSWARSLSIINHFHNGRNLDELAAGRENWRHSVQTLLNMQPEVSGRSHSQNQEETRRESRASRVDTQRESKSMRKSSIASNSRFSMRIIPSGKRSTLTDDLMDLQRISYVSNRSRASRKTSLKIRRDTLIETEDDLIRSAKDIILKRCKQTSYVPFDVCFPDSYINNCRKIGEGVYGEVFLYENGSEKSVIKIIPIEGDQLVNCEPQKKFHEILSEIIIAEELHKLRFDGEFHTNGFVEVNRIMCVIGKYPEKLIDLWYAYDEQKKSENDCPSMFEQNQLYIILELAHGGQDLEAYVFQNASESYAIFLQTALTLAVAEQSLEFEHRDLHWGNLLISKTEDKHSTYKISSEEISIPTKGVKVAVIDFTLSRMSYQGCKIFNDLAADPTLFEAQGEYQFDIYRMMRDNVNDDWQQFNPFTNILWMDYTLDKMITAVRYKKKTTKIHKSAIEDMKALRKEIMNYSSAFDFVTNCKKVQTLFDST